MPRSPSVNGDLDKGSGKGKGKGGKGHIVLALDNHEMSYL
jgi:hypothetical protein